MHALATMGRDLRDMPFLDRSARSVQEDRLPSALLPCPILLYAFCLGVPGVFLLLVAVGPQLNLMCYLPSKLKGKGKESPDLYWKMPHPTTSSSGACTFRGRSSD